MTIAKRGAAATEAEYYYSQTSEFTCGPASLIMAMKYCRPSLNPSREMEYQIWRESNTVFMGRGHAGCNPYGLAVAGRRRGFDVKLYIHNRSKLFEGWAEDANQQMIMDTVQELDRALAINMGITIVSDAQTMREAWSGQVIANTPDELRMTAWVILTRSRDLRHWVVVTQFSNEKVSYFDPWFDRPHRQTGRIEMGHMPLENFSRRAQVAMDKALAVIEVSFPRDAAAQQVRDRYFQSQMIPRIRPSVDVLRRDDVLKTVRMGRRFSDIAEDLLAGPRSLLKAMNVKDNTVPQDALSALYVWRESNMIFARSSMPVCGPYGLALTARHHGFDVRVLAHNVETILAPTQRLSLVKRRIQATMDHYDRFLALYYGVQVKEYFFGLDDIMTHLQTGFAVVLLISTGAYGHWVCLCGLEGKAKDAKVKVFDPWAERSEVSLVPQTTVERWLLAPRGMTKENPRAAIMIGPRIENSQTAPYIIGAQAVRA